MSRSRLPLTAVLLAALAAGLAGCSEGGESQAASSARYGEYVAIGDSYTAAPLVPPTDTSTICLRSGVNYPALVAAGLAGTTLTDVSCSGASTRNTVDEQEGASGSVPPQFDALDASTDLVTIGLGGNDENLFATLLGECTRIASTDPTGTPCKSAVAALGEVQPVLDRIRGNIAAVVDGVRERSPEAKIVVVGYPQIVPAKGTCDLLPLAAGDYPFARSVNEGLVEAVRRGAADAGADFVDLWEPSAGHDVCAADPWINGSNTDVGAALAYHPFAAEQRAVAELVLDEVS